MGRSVSVLRHSAVLAAVFVVFASMAVASASAAQLAVVAEITAGRVSLINTATNKAFGAPIGVGQTPRAIAITPNGEYAYVTNSDDESVSVIDVRDGRKLRTVEGVGKGPYGIAITPDGRYAYVTISESDEVVVISTSTNAVVERIQVGASPTGIAISPTTGLAYVTDSGEDVIETINTATMAIVGTPIEVGAGPTAIEFTPGGTAFIADRTAEKVVAFDPATRLVTSIPVTTKTGAPKSISISPSGREVFVIGTASISVINAVTKAPTGEIEVEGAPVEVAFSAAGKIAYISENTPSQVEAINVETGLPAAAPIESLNGNLLSGIALTPDQSPVAVFTPPSATVGIPAPFDGSASTDADGTIASYNWTFEDGRDATGVSAIHTFLTPGTFNAKLTVVDDEGCGEAMVFTGRTAYCSGGSSSVSHPVTVAAASVAEMSPPICKSNFGVGGLIHNRKNGTAKLRVNLRTAGSILLFGKKVHAISRKTKAAGSMTLTIHARVELNKRLKKIHRARVPVRITFTPSSGCGYKTVHRSISLLRAKKRRH